MSAISYWLLSPPFVAPSPPPLVGPSQSGSVSVFMAVPTMYSYLLSHYQHHMSPEQQAAACAAAAGLRLAVSGSAAAPLPLLKAWQEVSGGQPLLERYGMTETGMILSNPYQVGDCVSTTCRLHVVTCTLTRQLVQDMHAFNYCINQVWVSAEPCTSRRWAKVWLCNRAPGMEVHRSLAGLLTRKGTAA